MTSLKKIRVPVILGPTGVGKTEVSLRLADALGAEILSCDSRQIYRLLDIGTAKPTRQERESVRHWLIDILDPSEYYSAYRFSQDALAIVRNTDGIKSTKIICGGTGLYFQCLRDGLGPTVASNALLRESYKAKALKEGKEALYKELQNCDPRTAARLHPHDVQRVIRALQVYYETGIPLSSHHNNPQTQSPHDIIFKIFILMVPREILYRRINERVNRMIQQGLWEEFESIRNKGYGELDPGLHCVGYKELFSVEQGRESLAEAIEKIQRNSRNYAKRQITWFAHKTTGERIDMTRQGVFAEIKERIQCFLSP